MKYERMIQEELKQSAQLAAEAFYDYEYFSIFISDEKRRKRCLDAMIKCEFKANWNDPETQFIVAKENDRIVAVAQLCSSDYKKPSDFDYIRAGWLLFVKFRAAQIVIINAGENRGNQAA